MGELAGRATASREEIARQDVRERQTMQFLTQRAAQDRAAAHQRERDEFSAYLDMERFKKSESFELYKMEQRSLHDFDMIEARRFAENENQIRKEIRADAEKETKRTAIYGSDILSAEEKRTAIVKLEYDISLRQPPLPKPGEEMRTFEADYDYYLGITERFKKDVKAPMPGINKVVDVAILDKKGKVVREATPAEKAQFSHAERRLTELGERFKPRADVVEPAADRTGQRIPQPVVQPAIKTWEMIGTLERALTRLPQASKESLRKIIESNDPEKIRIAYERLGR